MFYLGVDLFHCYDKLSLRWVLNKEPYLICYFGDLRAWLWHLAALVRPSGLCHSITDGFMVKSHRRGRQHKAREERECGPGVQLALRTNSFHKMQVNRFRGPWSSDLIPSHEALCSEGSTLFTPHWRRNLQHMNLRETTLSQPPQQLRRSNAETCFPHFLTFWSQEHLTMNRV